MLPNGDGGSESSTAPASQGTAVPSAGAPTELRTTTLLHGKGGPHWSITVGSQGSTTTESEASSWSAPSSSHMDPSGGLKALRLSPSADVLLLLIDPMR
mmetsp:Transcript_103862/g.274611  ORF Transcript_103862/g.274611 Transcript_103862/m.274611 type:complete len:99 (+) Transcript_103862:318-614(+)